MEIRRLGVKIDEEEGEEEEERKEEKGKVNSLKTTMHDI